MKTIIYFEVSSESGSFNPLAFPEFLKNGYGEEEARAHKKMLEKRGYTNLKLEKITETREIIE